MLVRSKLSSRYMEFSDKLKALINFPNLNAKMKQFIKNKLKQILENNLA